MKIKLKITLAQLTELNGQWRSYAPTTKNEQAAISIMHQVEIKCRLKAFSKREEPADKAFTISFHYHEAYFLEQRVNNWLEEAPSGSFLENTLRSILGELNQKLCV